MKIVTSILFKIHYLHYVFNGDYSCLKQLQEATKNAQIAGIACLCSHYFKVQTLGLKKYVKSKQKYSKYIN